jgi:Ras-related protein Rab-8A
VVQDIIGLLSVGVRGGSVYLSFLKPFTQETKIEKSKEEKEVNRHFKFPISTLATRFYTMSRSNDTPRTAPTRTRGGDFDVQLKILLIGDSGVGKTSLLQRYTADAFSSNFISTIGIDFKTKVLTIDGTRARCQIWDTAGQERFRTITTSYFRGAHGIALCFDASDRRSFSSIASWIAQVSENADAGVCLILIGTKSDAPAAVTREDAATLCERFSTPERPIPFFFTSAKANVGVIEAFEGLATLAVRRMMSQEPAVRKRRIATVGDNKTNTTDNNNDIVNLGEGGDTTKKGACGMC